MKQFILTATMLLVCSLANAQCGHFELKNSNLFKGTQKSVIYNINDMWDLELIAENVKSYDTYSTKAYWRCTVLVLKTNGELYKYTQYGENKELLATKVSDLDFAGDMILVSYNDGSSSMMLATD